MSWERPKRFVTNKFAGNEATLSPTSQRQSDRILSSSSKKAIKPKLAAIHSHSRALAHPDIEANHVRTSGGRPGTIDTTAAVTIRSMLVSTPVDSVSTASNDPSAHAFTDTP